MPTKQSIFIEKMTQLRGMDWVRIGMMVEMSGHIGTIKGMNSSANLDVLFANQQRMGSRPLNCHPKWNIRYFDENGNIICFYDETGDLKEDNRHS